MKKILTLIIISIIGIYFSTPAYAQEPNQPVKLIQNTEVKQINNLLEKFLKYSNDHDIEGIKKLYAPTYISGDGLKKDDLISMIKDTWNTYNDMKYSSDIKDIRVVNNIASVESFDKAISTAGKKSTITDDTGILESNSHNIVYLQKFGKEWKIISDKVNYESTIIKYGIAKNLNIKFGAPEQICAGNEFTASLYTDVPERAFALGSITREPIVYPQAKTDEVFRQIPPETGILERVMKANATNNNELVSASVGYTEIVGNSFSNPELKLTGLAILLQRVNVVPKSAYIEVNNKSQVEDDTEDNVLPEDSDK